MPERTISTSGLGSEPKLDQEIHKLFVSELVAPSKVLWIASAWLSDIPVVDNRGGELSDIAPELPTRTLRLTEVLGHQVAGGAVVHIVMRKDTHNATVLARLQEIRSQPLAGVLMLGQLPNLHEKILLTDRLKVSGSMNLTYNGRLRNTELVHFTNDQDAIERQRIDLDRRYSGELS
ncbi:phospholipase D-like domain-containing protein DpdK [Lolliginicoccus suaedae]|uniref:phospholipase D-like domain-containing protein DpdK n=1 Tax=Lolliginicoccus suaedae TaxID=2605429 RepID=UPI0011EF27F7|nr:phospholipase D-like domain-containing protein DpdK [Lolliginicoccus suaedae]